MEENAVNSEEKKTQIKQDVPDNLTKIEDKAKTKVEKVLSYLSDKLLTAPIITVFVTALLGPIAIQWVNDGIENKKLQEKVIQTVLNYTNEADFSKPESIEKIGIIAQMVNENKDVFELSFEETNKAIDNLNSASNDVGIKNLDRKLKEAEAGINEFQAKIIADSTMYSKLIVDKENLQKEAENNKKFGNFAKSNDIEYKIAKVDLDIKEMEKNRIFNRERIKYWSEQKIQLQKDIQDATQDLANVLSENRSQATILNQEKEQLQTELAKIIGESNLMKNRITELEAKIQNYQDSISILKVKKKKNK